MKKYQRITAWFLAVIMLLLVPLSPLGQYFTAYASGEKQFEIDPNRIDPHDNSSITINILWQYTQAADVYATDSSGNKIATIASNKMINGYDGDIEVNGDSYNPTHEHQKSDSTPVTWNNVNLDKGIYYIVAEPRLSVFKIFTDRAVLAVGDAASGNGSSEVFVDPNLSSGKFEPIPHLIDTANMEYNKK